MHFDHASAENLLSIMQNRRDVRGNNFLEKQIEKEKIDMILDAALTAPSVGYSQPWEFVLIEDRSIKDKIYSIFEEENAKAKHLFSDRSLYEKLKLEGIKEAPVNIAVLYKKQKEPILGQTSMMKMGEYSTVCAVQNMWLMARSLNIGMGWVSIVDEKRVLQIIKAESDDTLVAYLCVGYVNEFYGEPELKTIGWEEEKRRELTVRTLGK